MWVWFIAVAGAAVLWFGGGNRIWRELQLGNHLTAMTNVFEEVERTRLAMPIGMGGGIDSLPHSRQQPALLALSSGVNYLRKFPRHEVTKALVKNAIMAERQGRDVRLRGMDHLLEYLVRQNVALAYEEFAPSFLD